MATFTRSLSFRTCVLLLFIPLLLLSACSGVASTGSGSKGPIIVSGKQDIEAQVLSEMDVLLLQKAGYTIVSKQALGDSPIVFNAIKSNAVDLYPEFTVTGLNILHLKSSHDPQKIIKR